MTLSNKHFIIGIVSLVLVIAVILQFSLKSEGDSTNNTELNAISSNPRNLDAQRVFIKDFHKFDHTIDKEARRTIEKTLYANTVMDKDFDHSIHYTIGSASHSESHASSEITNPDLYTGMVRPNSFADTSTANSRTIKLLVDIEPANLTYEVKIVEQNIGNTKSKSIYVSCAPPELSLDPTVKCMQGAA